MISLSTRIIRIDSRLWKMAMDFSASVNSVSSSLLWRCFACYLSSSLGEDRWSVWLDFKICLFPIEQQISCYFKAQRDSAGEWAEKACWMASFPRRPWVLPCPQLVCLSQSNYRWGVGFVWSLCHDFWGWSWLYRFYGITEGTMLTSHCSLFEQKCISKRHRFLPVVPNLFGTRDKFHGR